MTHAPDTDALASAFRALGDPIRLRLFYLLSRYDEVCVCHLTAALALPQSTVSRHLGVLRHAGVVEARREGKWMHYRLRGKLAPALVDLIEKHGDAGEWDADAKRLAQVLGGCIKD